LAECGDDVGAAGLEVLEAACARDPVCGCAWLGGGLLGAAGPAAQRRGIEVTAQACERGAIQACDTYGLVSSGCLSMPEWPLCDDLRARGELPAPFPPTHVLGCHRSRGFPGSIQPRLSVEVCLAEDRISVSDAEGRWDQWRVEKWHREDTREQAIWVADGVEGPSIFLTPVLEFGTTYFFTQDGLLQVMLEAERNEDAERRLAALVPVEEVCRDADACELAPLPGRVRECEAEIIGFEEGRESCRPSPGPRTWRHCHQRWSAAAHARLEGMGGNHPRPSLPPVCGTVESRDPHERDPDLGHGVYVYHRKDLVLQPPFATDKSQ
jgi:hypothetical protein